MKTHVFQWYIIVRTWNMVVAYNLFISRGQIIEVNQKRKTETTNSSHVIVTLPDCLKGFLVLSNVHVHFLLVSFFLLIESFACFFKFFSFCPFLDILFESIFLNLTIFISHSRHSIPIVLSIFQLNSVQFFPHQKRLSNVVMFWALVCQI